MEWKPKRWLAALLSVVIAPLGLLYVQWPQWALGYFLTSLALQLATIGSVTIGLAGSRATSVMMALVWGLNVAAAIHAFRIATVSPSNGPRRWYSRWYGLISIPLAVYCVALLIRSFLYEPFRFPSESMYPAVPKGSFVFVKKLGYGDYGSLGLTFHRTEPTAQVSRGELLLFRLPGDPNTVFLKRVIGLPGDHVECRERQLVINGTLVPTTPKSVDAKYQYVSETIDGEPVTIAHLLDRVARNCDVVVPPDHYFMLGDNRTNSRDSRYFGTVPRANLVGRAAVIIPAKVTK